MYTMYSSNMSLMNPQDTNVMQPNGMYGNNQAWGNYGMNTQAMDSAQMLPNQMPTQPTPIEQKQPTTIEQKMAEMQQQQRQANAYKIMGQGIANMGKGMQMQMPSGNTAQIMRDQNQFRFAGTPQQQMAQALRRR